MRAARRGTIAAIVLVAVCSACGSGTPKDQESPAPAPTPTRTAATRAEWVALADAACKEAGAKLATLRKPKTPDEIASLGPPAVEINTKLLRDLQAIEPAPPDKADVADVLDKIGRLFEGSRRLVIFAQHKERAKFETQAKGLQDLSTEAAQATKSYGLKICGSS